MGSIIADDADSCSNISKEKNAAAHPQEAHQAQRKRAHIGAFQEILYKFGVVTCCFSVPPPPPPNPNIKKTRAATQNRENEK